MTADRLPFCFHLQASLGCSGGTWGGVPSMNSPRQHFLGLQQNSRSPLGPGTFSGLDPWEG